MVQHKEGSHPQGVLIDAIVQGMQAKKAQGITILNLQHIGSAIAAYFILCTGRAKKQVEAITAAIMQ